MLCDIALPYYLLGFAFCDLRNCLSLFAMACSLQDGDTALKNAARYGHAEVVQALLDAGADRYAEVRMTPCSQMIAREIILSMGYCCSLLTVYGVIHASCDDILSCGCPVSTPVTVLTLTAAYLVYVQDNDGWIPLIWAAYNGHARCIQLLVEYVPKVM